MQQIAEPIAAAAATSPAEASPDDDSKHWPASSIQAALYLRSDEQPTIDTKMLSSGPYLTITAGSADLRGQISIQVFADSFLQIEAVLAEALTKVRAAGATELEETRTRLRAIEEAHAKSRTAGEEDDRRG